MQTTILSVGRTITLLLFIFLSQVTHAQRLTDYNWYFGNSAKGIKFNRGTTKPEAITSKATPFGSGGSAVATDPTNGNLLFYTDGNFVYDACNNQMPKGFGLSGTAAANQPVAICAVPGQLNKYFIFTNSADFTSGGAVNVSVVDLSLNGSSVFPNPALGDLETKNTPIATLTGTSEGMVILPHSNGIDFWLITHKNNSADFKATLINAASYTGTFNPLTTSIGSPSQIPISVANFSVSPFIDPAKKTLRTIAVAPQSGNDDALIVNFDITTGKFAFDSYILNTGKKTIASQSIYDIQWDWKGQYVYLSYFGDVGIKADVVQYDYKNPTNTLTSVLPATLNPAQSLGLQLGPDSAMYYLYKSSAGQYQVGSFSKTDTVAVGVKFKSLALGNLDFNGTQFPSFLAEKDLGGAVVSFVPIAACQNGPTAFYPTVTPAADSLIWNFGDGAGSNNWSPVHTFSKAGSFNVAVTAYLQGQKKTYTQAVSVQAFALKITLVQDTTACRDEFPPKRGKSLPVQFSVTAKVKGGVPASSDWSNGQKGLVLKPDSAGFYYLTVSDGLGCAVSAGVNVKEYGLNDQRSNKWYFGNKAGIDFTTNKALSDGAMTAPEGCAIVCDRNGQTIFYTDGNTVYDRTNTAIDTGIGGSIDDASSQSSLIFQVPGDETLYYIFTTQAIESGSANEVRYSLFDWKKNNGKGAIAQKNVLLFSKTTERVTANGNWVIFHEYGNNVFRSYRVTANGIGKPIFSSVGTDHSQCVADGEGYMRLGPKNTLAVPVKKSDGNFIELFHLNDTTGQIVKFSKVDTDNLLDTKELAGQIYGIEFASSNKKGVKLFATINNGASSKFVEFTIDSLNKSTLLNKIPSPDLGALQTAPNGVIYASVKGANTLSLVAPGKDLTINSSLVPNAFPLAPGTTSLLGLPNFRQQQGNGFGGPAFTYTGVCVGDSTKFTGQGTDSIDKYLWSFGDGGSSTNSTVSHLYAKAGIYNVSFRVYNRCKLDTTLSAKVVVYDPPAKPSLTAATVLCNGPVTLDANKPNTAGLTYAWSTGEIAKTIVVNRDLAVSVTNTDVNGCLSKANTLVVDNRPQLELGPDQTVCQNNAVNVLDAGNKGATYVWTVNGVKSGSTIQQQAVDTTLPGVTTYGVTVTDPITQCIITDQVKITVNASPSFALSKTDPVSCGGATGTFSILINPTIPSGGPYSYFLTGPGTPAFNKQAVDQPAGTSITFNNQPAGTFSGIVTDQISGCTISQSLALVDAGWTIKATGNCNPANVVVSASPNPTVPILPLTYTFTGTGSGSPIITKDLTITKIPEGTWTVQATDASGCIAADPTPLVVNPNPTISVAPDNACNPAQLSATVLDINGNNITSGYTFQWSLPPTGTPTLISGNPLTNVKLSGNYTATATAAGCSFSQIYPLNFTVITPTVTQSDPCSDQVTLTAAPSGNYSYTWVTTNPTSKAILIGQQINLTSGDDGNYQVTLKDRSTGCPYTSSAVPANVVGAITATVASTPPCKDGKPFTLTATTTPTTGLTYQWNLNGAALAATTAITDQSSEGKYQVTVSSSAVAACKAVSSITIARGPLPVGNLPSGAIICSDPENKDPLTAKVDLDPGAFVSYQWYKNELLLADITRQITATSAGIYKVDITNSYNCTASDLTEVRNECIPKLVAPNAFRPGSKSADNQNFSVFSFFITDVFEVVIFNRWGEIVFESKDKNFRWNGNYNNSGQALPPGTYAYVLKYTSSFRPDKGILEQRGGVVLIR